MTDRKTYGLCCSCGYAVPTESMFIKQYEHTAFCICKDCAKLLCAEIEDFITVKSMDRKE